MWLFCKHGFFSAVQHKDDATKILVRSRIEGDLERLFRHNRVRAKIAETPFNDYRFRAVVPRSVWSRIVSRESDEIDYGNFKNAVHDGTVRDRAYMQCWCAMSNAQHDAYESNGESRRADPYDGFYP